MFNIFRNRKNKIEKDILKVITYYSKISNSKTSFMIWIEDQILYQIEHPTHYIKHFGYEINNDELVEVHFFNKNKTLTIYAEQYFIENDIQKEYKHYEEPTGNNTYIRTIKKAAILESINNCLKDIYKIDLDKLRVEIVKYE